MILKSQKSYKGNTRQSDFIQETKFIKSPENFSFFLLKSKQICPMFYYYDRCCHYGFQGKNYTIKLQTKELHISTKLVLFTFILLDYMKFSDCWLDLFFLNPKVSLHLQYIHILPIRWLDRNNIFQLHSISLGSINLYDGISTFIVTWALCQQCGGLTGSILQLY